jgi:hypothetical protein
MIIWLFLKDNYKNMLNKRTNTAVENLIDSLPEKKINSKCKFRSF